MQTKYLLSLPIFIIFLLISKQGSAAENACGPSTVTNEQSVNLLAEKEILTLKLNQLESLRNLPIELLNRKKALRLKEIAVDVKNQRLVTTDFEGFFTWMSSNLASYNRYLQAGSYAAMAAKFLPVPYAGQASLFTKFVSQFTVSLNNASVAISNYQKSSAKFISMVEAMDKAGSDKDKLATEAMLFADQQLLKDMNEAEARLASVSDLSSGALSFLASLNHYVGGTDEYWNKAKGIFKKDIDPKERSFISESTNNLKNRADNFNSKITGFKELGKKETFGIKALAVYDELAAEIALLR
ncbi:MAG: hypothetical protein A2079_05485 [Geobacteraceae bacterium GWC2_48_7]|nr:MAG: hypothetical protein A2079_05485 [Geobacteraceae bacterium GWC2_48_7]